MIMVLYYSVLNFTILYYTVLYCIVLYYTVQVVGVKEGDDMTRRTRSRRVDQWGKQVMILYGIAL